MKIISIGDIHGRNFWKKIDPSKYDLIVFVGDYTDSYIYKDSEILINLHDIIAFKKAYSDKVVLLLGNHDIQYFFMNEGYGCSGFRPSMASSLNETFKSNKKLFNVAHQVDNYIWTHAGISNGWFKYNEDEINEVSEKFETGSLAETLNHMHLMNRNYCSLLHQVGRKRQGRYPYGGITWADRDETKNNYLNGYHQIVGHTPIETITKFGDDKSSIRYIDVLAKLELYKKDEEIPDQIEKFYEHEILGNATQQAEIC